MVIIGGPHGDLPLDASAGKVFAELVVEHPGFYVVDLSGTESNAAQDRFATDFAERLYRLKGPVSKHTPLHLFVDEADSFAPQRPMPGQQRMLGAMEAIVRRGRIRGLGVTLITQRAAVLNKNVLTQTEALIILQTTSPQDRKAIDDWVAGNATKEERDQVMESLASLERGEAWFWSPAWLRVLQRIRVRERRTFNSSATPEAGVLAAPGPSRLADVDLEELRERLASTIAKAEQEDPARLRKRIAELERELQEWKDRAQRATDLADRGTAAGEQANALRALYERRVTFWRDRAADAVENMKAAAHIFNDTLASYEEYGDEPEVEIPLREAVDQAPRGVQAASARKSPAGGRGQTPVATPGPVLLRPDKPPPTERGGTLGKAERSILSVLAQFPAGRTKGQLAMLARYAVNGGGFNNAISSLRTKGFVEGSKDQLRITEAGLSQPIDWEPLPTGEALLQYWVGQVPKAAGMVLQVLAESWPEPVSKAEVAERTGYEASGGGFNNALSRLRTLDLITRGDPMRANDDLMEAVRNG